MSTEHTFGSWTAEQSEEEAVTGEWTIVDGDGGLIAEVPNPYTTYEMQVSYAAEPDCPLEAYARLIAASPTLFEYVQRRAEEGDSEARALVESVHATS